MEATNRELLEQSIIACAKIGEYPAMIQAAEKLNIEYPRAREKELNISIKVDDQGRVAVKQA